MRLPHLQDLPLRNRQLTKEEEAAAGGEDMEVRREDQEKINRFSSLHQKETSLEEELRAKIVSTVPLCKVLSFHLPQSHFSR
jgi:prefoldin subunit 4